MSPIVGFRIEVAAGGGHDPMTGLPNRRPTAAEVRAVAAYLAAVPLDAPSDTTIGALRVCIDVQEPNTAYLSDGRKTCAMCGHAPHVGQPCGELTGMAGQTALVCNCGRNLQPGEARRR